MTEHGPNPESIPDQTERFVVPDVKTAFERALTGDGIAIVKELGIDEASRQALCDEIRQTEVIVGNGPLTSNARYYCDFDHEMMRDLLSPVMDGLGDEAGDYMVANMQVVEYLPGASLGEHIDIDSSDSSFMGMPATSLSFIWVMKGQKELVARPASKEGVAIDQIRLTQSPDMLIILRGGLVEIAGELYPGVPHQVPAVNEESVILSFELGSRAEHEAYEAELLADSEEPTA